jgi:hypothetical protein
MSDTPTTNIKIGCPVSGPSFKKRRKGYTFTAPKARRRAEERRLEQAACATPSLQAPEVDAVPVQFSEVRQYAKRGGPYRDPVKRVLQAEPYPDDYVPPPPPHNKPPSRFWPTRRMDMEGQGLLEENPFVSKGDAPGPVEDKRIRKPSKVFDPSDPAVASQCVDPAPRVMKKRRKRVKKEIPEVAPPASPLPDTVFEDIDSDYSQYNDEPVPRLVGMTLDDHQDHIDACAFKHGEDLGPLMGTRNRNRSPDPTEDLD